MPKQHNKKRNIGIIYEQIISFVCESLINEKKKDAEKAISIIKNNFSAESQLYKEYKLFKALSETYDVSDQLATMIITEAKSASNIMFDSKKLEKEKSKLIKELNYSFGKGEIFNKNVKNYRVYATIQTLLYEWRNNSKNFDKVAEYEIVLHNSLTESRKPLASIKPTKVSTLTYKLMNEIFEKKYKNNLNKSQNNIISLYVNEDYERLNKEYEIIKERVFNCISLSKILTSNKVLQTKKDIVTNKITSLKTEDNSKENLHKYLLALKLEEEILGE
jgi:hypothetical protein